MSLLTSASESSPFCCVNPRNNGAWFAQKVTMQPVAFALPYAWWRSLMSYRCVATSVAGFIQQLAGGYINNGYYFYVAGVLPHNKPAEKADSKMIAAYDIAGAKWTRARRKRTGQANVQYLRCGRFYVIVATHGVHPFFSAEAKRLRDVRKTPILFQNYSIGCRHSSRLRLA
jgi:hypothetical protein